MAIKFDTHMHSLFSHDGNFSIEEMARRGVELGLTHICFTEHFDIEGDYKSYNYKAYSDAVSRVNDIYQGKITVLRGIEAGSPFNYRELFCDVLAKGYDFVLGSIHMVRGLSVAHHELNNGAEDNKLYYEQLAKLSEVKEIDAIAHFDYIRRGTDSDYYDKAVVYDIFKNMVANDIALEYNTSGIRRIDGGEPFPCEDKLKLYRAASGAKMTIGSDAHRLCEMASDFDKAEKTLQSIKGLQLGYFVDRKFIAQPIDLI